MRGLTRLLAGECGASSRPALSVDSGRTIAFDRGVANERDEQHRQYDEASPCKARGPAEALTVGRLIYEFGDVVLEDMVASHDCLVRLS